MLEFLSRGWMYVDLMSYIDAEPSGPCEYAVCAPGSVIALPAFSMTFGRCHRVGMEDCSGCASGTASPG